MTDRELMQYALEEIEGLVDSGYSGNIIIVRLLRERLAQGEPWVKTYCGGKPNYTTPPEPEKNT